MQTPTTDDVRNARKRLLHILLSRLVLPLSLLVILVLTVLGYLGYASVRSLQEQRVQALASLAGSYCQQGAGMLEASGVSLLEVADRDRDRVLESARTAYEVFDSLYLLNPEGRIVTTAPWNPSLIGMDLSGMEELQRARRDSGVVYSRPHISLNSQAPTIMMIRSVSDGGFIVGELDLSVLQKHILDQPSMLRSGVVYIMDRNGTLIGHPDYRLVLEQTNWASTPLYAAGRNADTSRVFVIDGTWHLGSTQRVDPLGWIVVEHIPLRVLLLPYALGIFGSGAFILLLQFGVVRALRRSLSGTLLEPLMNQAETERAYRRLAETDALEKDKLNQEMNRINAQLERVNTELNRSNEALGHEVHERQQAEENLAKANLQLQETLDTLRMAQDQMILQEKMAALGSLVAGITHDLNTPVGITVTMASFLDKESRAVDALLAEGKLNRERFKEYLTSVGESVGIMLNNLRRAEALIGSFRTVAANQGTDAAVWFSVRDQLNDILTSLSPKLKSGGVRITQECSDALKLFGSPGAFAQLLTNLIDNSLIHGFEGRDGGSIGIRFAEEGQAVRLVYQDNGVGLPPEVLKNLYTPFYTTKRGQGGTGLGMYIVYSLVTRQFGGEIKCTSSPGQGVAFTILFPVSAPADTRKEERP